MQYNYYNTGYMKYIFGKLISLVYANLKTFKFFKIQCKIFNGFDAINKTCYS